LKEQKRGSMNKLMVMVMAVLLLVFVGLAIHHNRMPKMVLTSDPQKQSSEVNKPKAELPLPKSYADALTYAKSKNKKLFVFFHADYCAACKKMNQETLKNESVLAALKNKGVCLVYYVNVDKEPLVASMYKAAVVPLYYIIDGNEAKSASGLGFKNPEDFITWLNGKSEVRIRVR
jgi:thiol:disulfide interchange protein